MRDRQEELATFTLQRGSGVMRAAELDFPHARVLAGKVQRYCREYVAQGVPLARADVILDVVDLEPEVDRRRWLDEFGRDWERVPTIDGGVVWLTDAEPWAILEE